jgi:hypothetical protein
VVPVLIQLRVDAVQRLRHSGTHAGVRDDVQCAGLEGQMCSGGMQTERGAGQTCVVTELDDRRVNAKCASAR